MALPAPPKGEPIAAFRFWFCENLSQEAEQPLPLGEVALRSNDGEGYNKRSSTMINGVIFDMDGLMFDTERMWATFWEPALAALGLE